MAEGAGHKGGLRGRGAQEAEGRTRPDEQGPADRSGDVGLARQDRGHSLRPDGHEDARRVAGASGQAYAGGPQPAAGRFEKGFLPEVRAGQLVAYGALKAMAADKRPNIKGRALAVA